jgi:hypothetical protein
MHGERLLANMTQYRVTARNCEAKRLHIVASTEPYVACDYAHVGAARQHEEAVATSPDGSAGWVNYREERRRVPVQAGVSALHYGKL